MQKQAKMAYILSHTQTEHAKAFEWEDGTNGKSKRCKDRETMHPKTFLPGKRQ